MSITNSILPYASALLLSIYTYEAGTVIVSKSMPPPIEGYGISEVFVQAGADTLVNWSIVKRTDCPGQSSRVWTGEGGFYVVEPLRSTMLPTGDIPQSYMIPTHIPEFAPVGRLELNIKGFYNCGAGQNVEFSLGPVVFEVIE